MDRGTPPPVYTETSEANSVPALVDRHPLPERGSSPFMPADPSEGIPIGAL